MGDDGPVDLLRLAKVARNLASTSGGKVREELIEIALEYERRATILLATAPRRRPDCEAQ